MERAISEVFEFDNEKLKVFKALGCRKCCFNKKSCDVEKNRKILGSCSKYLRKDNKSIIFVKIVD